MVKIINNENKKAVKFLTEEQKDLISRLEKGERFSLYHLSNSFEEDGDDVVFGLPAGIREPTLIALIQQGLDSNFMSGNKTYFNVGLEDEYRLCELPENERCKVMPEYAANFTMLDGSLLKIFSFSRDEYVPTLKAYLSKKRMNSDVWDEFAKLPREDVNEIMAYAIVHSNFSPHVLKDLAYLPARQQDEIREMAEKLHEEQKA